MSEEIIQKGYQKSGEPFGEFEYYNIGKTNIQNLLDYNIVPKKDYKEYKLKEPDAIIVDRRNKKHIQVIAIIEYKKPIEFNTDKKKKKAFEQCNNYAQALSAKIGIITDGDEYYWINPNIKYEQAKNTYTDDYNIHRGYDFIENTNGSIFKEYFDNTTAESINTIKNLLKIITNENSRILSDKTISPLSLAKQVWQAVFVATGDDPKKCLMTFTELFIFKFLSDLKIITQNDSGVPIDFDTIYNVGKDNCLKYYMKNARDYIKSRFPSSEKDLTTILNGLSLKEDQNQDLLFYEILSKFKLYGELKNIAPNFKSRLFEDFLKGTPGKKQLGQFFTPRNVIKAIVEMANVKNLKNGAKICDPASGVGGFINEAILNRMSNNITDFKMLPDKALSMVQYEGNDIDEMTIILAKANLLITLTEFLQENPTLTENISSLLNDIFYCSQKCLIGSLDPVKDEYYDLIMSNPPYIASGTKIYKDYIKNKAILKDKYKVRCHGKEGLFTQKIVRELKKNGEAFIILPDGFFYRPQDNDLKDYIVKNCYVNAIISLPQKTFYAKNKKTYILCIRKKELENIKQQHKIFLAIAKTIGESLDVDRISEPEKNDLSTIVKQYKYFSCDPISYNPKEQGLTKNTIKVIEFEKFEKNKNWLVEQYWTDEELEQLELKDVCTTCSEADIFDNIDSIKSDFDAIKNSITDELSKAPEFKNYKTVSILDENLFELSSRKINLTRKEYTPLDTKNNNDIPVYTAAQNPVAYFKNYNSIPYEATEDRPHISFASDGDGTAGGNIFLHKDKYYINTSRTVIVVKEKDILPEFIYCYLQDMKKKYGFDFRFKANSHYLSKIEIKIPTKDSSNKEYDIEEQKKFIEYYYKIQNIRKTLIDSLFRKINNFESDISYQLNKKLLDTFIS